jgi:hypothetical protein
MTKFEELLKDSLAYMEARKAPREELSAETKDGIKAALAKKFGKVLSEEAMRLVILKMLTDGTATGAEVVEKLKSLRLEMEPKGEGAILGLLYQMDNRGLIFATFDENTATRRYKIEDAGSALLQKDEATVLGGLGLSLSGNA